MVATINVEEGNGASPTWTVITSGRYKTNDTYVVNDSDPCVVPTSGSNYSYWKSHRMAWTGIGSSIGNIRWFTSGNIKANWTPGTGGGLFVGVKDADESGCPTESYDQADGVPGESGYPIEGAVGTGNNGHTFYKIGSANYLAPVDADTYIAATPLQVDAKTVPYTTNTHSKHVVSQVKLFTDATQGDKVSQTFTFRYDEV